MKKRIKNLGQKSPTKNDATVKIDRSLLINLAKPTMPVTRCKEAKELAIKNFAQTYRTLATGLGEQEVRGLSVKLVHMVFIRLSTSLVLALTENPLAKISLIENQHNFIELIYLFFSIRLIPLF